MSAIAFKADENPFTHLDEVIRRHVAQLPHYLQSEVYDFVLFLYLGLKPSPFRRTDLSPH